MASLTSLPPELQLHIVHLAIDAQTGMGITCARVARQWRTFAEMKTFSSLRLNQSRISASQEILTSDRRLYIRDIHMEVVLPKYEETRVSLQESQDELQQNNKAFTDGIVLLFKHLASWELPGMMDRMFPRNIHLTLSASSPSDSINSQGAKLYRRKVRWERSYLDLLKDAYFELPILHLISKFTCTTVTTYRNFSPAAICTIASHLHDVHTFDWDLSDLERHDNARRVRQREEFAKGLLTLPQSLRHFTLKYDGGVPLNHHWNPPQLYPGDESNPDPLSVSLRGLLQRLVTMELKNDIIVGSEMFWPSSPGSSTLSGDDSLLFPNIEELTIRSGLVTPSGSWLCSEDPSIGVLEPPHVNSWFESPVPGDEACVWFRLMFKPAILNRYYLAAAQAASRMPCLKSFKIMWQSPRANGLEYLVHDHRTTTNLELYGSPPLEPAVDLREAWQEATKAHVGDGHRLNIEVTDEGYYWTPIGPGIVIAP